MLARLRNYFKSTKIPTEEILKRVNMHRANLAPEQDALVTLPDRFTYAGNKNEANVAAVFDDYRAGLEYLGKNPSEDSYHSTVAIFRKGRQKIPKGFENPKIIDLGNGRRLVYEDVFIPRHSNEGLILKALNGESVFT